MDGPESDTAEKIPPHNTTLVGMQEDIQMSVPQQILDLELQNQLQSNKALFGSSDSFLADLCGTLLQMIRFRLT